MRHASLFTGIGGFDLAAQWMGWENIFQVEKDPFCQKVLEKNFPTVKRYGDIKEFNGTQYRGTVDILTGGFPCQPYSSSGKRKGKKDDRHLWPEMLRVIREIQPTYVVGENVYGLLTWNRGLVFEEMQAEMENEGYEVQAFILPAASVQAPHRRDRIWFIAHTLRDGFNRAKGVTKDHCRQSGEGMVKGYEPDTLPNSGTFTNSASHRRIQSLNRNESRFNNETDKTDAWQKFPTESPVRAGNDGLSSNLVRSTIHAAGNAIVPQVAFEIFKAIEQISNATP